MRAILLTAHGGPEVLKYREDVAKPHPGAGEVLIRVAACGLNNTDINTREGWYSRNAGGAGVGGDDATTTTPISDGGWGARILFPRIQGADVCGVVEALGDDAPAALLGARVMVDPWLLDPADPANLAAARFFGSEVDGGFAEYTLAPASNVHPIHSDYTDAELATFGCAYTTAANLLRRSAVAAGEVVVVSGASGGVGSALVQLAKLRGAKVVALASADKIPGVSALGADQVIDRRHPKLPQTLATAIAAVSSGGDGGVANVASVSGGGGSGSPAANAASTSGSDGDSSPAADVAIDIVGGDTFTLLLNCLRRGGRYATSGAIAGATVPLDLRTLYLHDLQLIGATVPPPGTFAEVLRQIETKQLRPLLAHAFPLHELPAAQQMFLTKQHIGNIVVTIDG